MGCHPNSVHSGGYRPVCPCPALDRIVRAALLRDQPPFPFVLLHGESKAGKSRTLAEAVKSIHHASELLMPRDVAARRIGLRGSRSSFGHLPSSDLAG